MKPNVNISVHYTAAKLHSHPYNLLTTLIQGASTSSDGGLKSFERGNYPPPPHALASDMAKPYQIWDMQRSCADANSPYNRKC
jgi:hypothetical protein